MFIGTLSPGTGLAELLEGKLRNFEDKRGGGRTDRSVTVSDVTFLSQSIWEIYRRVGILSVASPLSPHRLCCSADAPGQQIIFGAWFFCHCLTPAHLWVSSSRFLARASVAGAAEQCCGSMPSSLADLLMLTPTRGIWEVWLLSALTKPCCPVLIKQLRKHCQDWSWFSCARPGTTGVSHGR